MIDLPASAPPPPEVVAMLAMLSSADDGGGLDAGMIMGQLGIADGQLPTRSAPIHRLLDAAPPAVREALLVLFFGELFS